MIGQLVHRFLPPNSTATPVVTNAAQTTSAEVEQLNATLRAIKSAVATIELSPSGVVLDANPLFLTKFGYALNELVGQHYAMLLEPQAANSSEETQLWRELNNGQPQVSICKRLGNGQLEFWMQTTSVPITDANGKVVRILQQMADVTEQHLEHHSMAAQLEAINRAEAVIEFNLDSTIVKANENFCLTTGYTLEEIVGRPHRMFVPDDMRDSQEYAELWDALRRGEHQTGQFRRVTKSGQEIWIEGAYNPILDEAGRPIKVLKHCHEITQQIKLRQRSIEVGNVVASSASQFVETLAEISNNVNQTADIASRTARTAEVTTAAVADLEASSRVIEKVVEVIQDLADQTSLLALNATIESARAGEAGKSFAVVASEVKELARQTAGATTNIEKSVAEIKSSINGVVNSAGDITCSVGEVSSMMSTIAAAIEEQSATMSTLSQTASELRR